VPSARLQRAVGLHAERDLHHPGRGGSGEKGEGALTTLEQAAAAIVDLLTGVTDLSVPRGWSRPPGRAAGPLPRMRAISGAVKLT